MPILLMLAIGIFQGWLAYLGIEHHFGAFWAISVLVAWFVTGLGVMSVLISVGAYFGIVDALGWEWYWGLMAAAPVLIFLIIPNVLISVFQNVSNIASQEDKDLTTLAPRIPSPKSEPKKSSSVKHGWLSGLLTTLLIAGGGYALLYYDGMSPGERALLRLEERAREMMFSNNDPVSEMAQRQPLVNDGTDDTVGRYGNMIYLTNLDARWTSSEETPGRLLSVTVRNETNETFSDPITLYGRTVDCTQYQNFIRLIQESLLGLGFQPGTIYGTLNSSTRDALSGYQASVGLEVTGRLNLATLDSLGVRQDYAEISQLDLKHRGRIQGNESIAPNETVEVRFHDPLLQAPQNSCLVSFRVGVEN